MDGDLTPGAEPFLVKCAHKNFHVLQLVLLVAAPPERAATPCAEDTMVFVSVFIRTESCVLRPDERRQRDSQAREQESSTHLATVIALAGVRFGSGLVQRESDGVRALAAQAATGYRERERRRHRDSSDASRPSGSSGA